MAKLFNEGDKVELLQACVGMADDACDEIVMQPGTRGKVVCVRECSEPDGPQGPWLYDVEFDVTVEGRPDMVWGIYDAEDAHQLARVA